MTDFVSAGEVLADIDGCLPNGAIEDRLIVSDTELKLVYHNNKTSIREIVDVLYSLDDVRFSYDAMNLQGDLSEVTINLIDEDDDFDYECPDDEDEDEDENDEE